MVPLTSYDADTSTNIAPHFDYIDLTNVVVHFKMPLASHDADAGASGIT